MYYNNKGSILICILVYSGVLLILFPQIRKEFAEIQKAKYADGRYEHKNALFHQLGMVKGTGEGFVYDAWYNGGYYIEIYASDVDYADSTFADYVRTQINYNA